MYRYYWAKGTFVALVVTVLRVCWSSKRHCGQRERSPAQSTRKGYGIMQNNPLHIQPIQEGIANPLKYDFLTFVGLDAVDSILLEQRERSESHSVHPLLKHASCRPVCLSVH